MAAPMKNLTPYECTIKALNLSSGHPISNILYYMDLNDHGGGYGADVVGSDEDTFNDNVFNMWTANAASPGFLLSQQYQVTATQTRPISGRAYSTPILGISNIVSTLTDTHIITASPHNLVPLQTVQITGVTVPAGLNKQWSVVSVVSPTEFTINIITAGVYSGPGKVQLVRGTQDFTFFSNLEKARSFLGSNASDQMPLYSTISMRRLNSGVGKHWKSRISLSPIGESDQNNGRLTVAALGIWVATGLFMSLTLNGGGPSTNSPIALSKDLAMLVDTPFTIAASFIREVNQFVPRTNLGSLVKRKPRLTSAITP